jgi:hypothetical protein
MANTNIDLVGLDFNSLKNNLKSFLKNNTQFKDIDYEGSNIGVLLDVLAYNTYLNGFYTNMVASEMFLDSAQLKDSVTSHAKELNYTPRSFNSAEAQITVVITPVSAVTSIVVPEYTSFTSRVGSNTYTFSTAESQVLTNSVNGVYSASLKVYEGLPTTETYVVNSANTKQRFVISNPTIDIASLGVTIYEDGGQTITPYTKVDNIAGVTSTSPVFFVQGAENQQYEIIFGDDVFGKKPKDGSTAVIKYRTSSGELPNGASLFVADSAIDGHTSITVTTSASASGGAISESVDSIRYNAPRAFQAQDRAVTVSDYETLLTNRFSDIQAISVYGGEDADPPQFGKVYISVDVFNADGVSESRKSIFKNYIQDKTPITIGVLFVDPVFMYVHVTSNVSYDVNITNKTTSDITTLVQGAISTYSLNSLENFKKTLYHSMLTKQIDAADLSIIGNDTSIQIAIRVVPQTNSNYSFVVETYNELASEIGPRLDIAEVHYGHTLTSSYFTYNGVQCLLVDNTLGNVYIAAQQGSYITPLISVGTLNYTTGKLQIFNFNITGFDGNYLNLFFTPKSKNIQGFKNVILAIAPTDVTVNVTGVKK